MRKLIVSAFVSADGVAQGPGDDPGYPNARWTMTGVEVDLAAYELKGREQEEAGAVLLGRRSYEMFAPIWPSMAEFGGYNAMPRYVVSTTLEHDDDRWPAGILRSLEEVAALKETDGAPIIVHGSLALGHALADAGLVDRYHVLVFPVLLGSGTRLFSDSAHDTVKVAIAEHEVYGNGVQKLVYDVVR
ncbi:dihydrofolate reductase family protein [Microbacterium sp. ASV49]|uniref:Dihydrofolate reductase family protein n=1 Tax=Microbacterium candidum TaxID=3041922 RepID=A0ABT7MU27_9MICO|nr:dihydrofolate reductase family protein [Microbacterium sp. ASV49]MDL9977950.1 dihydrofolate reductase family protein [Microbacterium sp. ASV49]